MERPKIVFDLFGVITTEPLFATKVVFPLLEERIDYNLFKKRYILYCVGMITRDEFWGGLADGEDINRMEQRIHAATMANKDMLSFIKEVGSSHELVIASEAPARWANAILKSYGVVGSFSQRFFSSDLHATKPFKRFFDHVFKPTKKRVFYIDDTLENLKAAAVYGPKLAWYGGKGQEPGVASVSSVAELRKLL